MLLVLVLVLEISSKIEDEDENEDERARQTNFSERHAYCSATRSRKNLATPASGASETVSVSVGPRRAFGSPLRCSNS